jgi:nucleotide-binding universal stress UspA family protein/DNA-binding CsgD family transcriptional regulator
VLYVQEELLLKKWTDQSMREARKKLRQKSKTWSQQNSLTVTTRTTVGKPFVEIIRRARAEQADVVLVGAHGEHFLRDLFLGTTAEAVIRKGDRTVLVVKQLPHGPYQRVLVPVDFSDASRQALEAAFALAPVAEFHIFHATGAVFEEQLRLGGLSESDIIRHRRRAVVDAKQDMERFLRDIDCGTRHVRSEVQSGRALHGITQAVAHLGADLVAMGTRGRSDLPYTSDLDAYTSLTNREREILNLILSGNTNAQIAEQLVLSPRTVETHRANMMRKINVHNQAELMQYALRRGLLSP